MLLSLQYNYTSFDIERQSHNIFWITWAISMAVTISNGFNQLLGLERKYILRNVSVSQIQKDLQFGLFTQAKGRLIAFENEIDEDWKKERLQIIDSEQRAFFEIKN